jgi:hypothetical protein
MKKIFTLLFLSVVITSFSQSTTVVISQVYGGGGANTGTPTYKNDYVELYNKSNTTQDISGFVLAYGSSTGQFGSSATNYFTFPASTTIAPGKYLFIQLGTVGTAGADFPVTPDFVTTNINAAAANGKFALFNTGFVANSCGATATPCTLPNTSIVDLVAYGTSNNAEGGSPVPALSVTTGAVRKQNGALDTDNNANDFDVVTNPVPRNSSYVMPLNLLGFRGAVINGDANLVWNTANEVNVAGFIVEKSTNGSNFENVGFVAAKNTASATYNFTTSLTAGNNFYRLKMLDKDGTYSYSKVITLNNRTGLKLELFPNPVVNTLTLTHEKATETARVKVTAIDGKILLTQVLQAGATQSTVDVSKLTKGTYVLVYDNDGKNSAIVFVKQ